jgi:hypothetical protein
MTIIILLAAGIFVFYLFSNDKKDEKIKVLQKGGLKTIYPNFVQYIELANSGEYSHEFSLAETKFILAKNDGEYLEYKFPMYSFNGELLGYYYIGIQHTFGALAYCYCVNSKGRKIEGYMSELHNGRNSAISRDRQVDNYRSIFSSLIFKMESTPNFENKFYHNN